MVDGEVLDRDRARATRGHDRDRGAERREHRRRILGRVGVRETAADGRLVADPHRGDAREGVRERRRERAHVGRALRLPMRRGRADAEAAVVRTADPGERADRAQADDVARPDEPLAEEEHGRGAARYEVRILAVLHEEVESLGDLARLVVVVGHTFAADLIARSIP